jgi:hypothetical protein
MNMEENICLNVFFQEVEMRKFLCLMFVVLVTSGAQVLYFNIAPASGFSEPLSSGDVIEISATTQPSVGHDYGGSSGTSSAATKIK